MDDAIAALSAQVVSLHDRLREGDRRLNEEQDRRYAEVNAARAEALRIKEDADRRALELAREIQAYKDEKLAVTVQMNSDYITSQQGTASGRETLTASTYRLLAAIVLIAGLAGHYLHT